MLNVTYLPSGKAFPDLTPLVGVPTPPSRPLCEIFASLPFKSLGRMALKRKLDEIGASRPSAA